MASHWDADLRVLFISEMVADSRIKTSDSECTAESLLRHHSDLTDVSTTLFQSLEETWTNN